MNAKVSRRAWMSSFTHSNLNAVVVLRCTKLEISGSGCRLGDSQSLTLGKEKLRIEFKRDERYASTAR